MQTFAVGSRRNGNGEMDLICTRNHECESYDNCAVFWVKLCKGHEKGGGWRTHSPVGTVYLNG